MSKRDGYEPGVPCWIETWQPEAGAGRTAVLADRQGAAFSMSKVTVGG